MSAAASSPEFADQWFDAKWNEDYEKCVSLAFDRHDESDVPPWLAKEITELNTMLTVELSNNLDRKDDSFLGETLIHLAALEDWGQTHSLLGLAYECNQPHTLDRRPLNPQIPDLLFSQLEVINFLPRDKHPDMHLAWHEIAIRRVSGLIRADTWRHVEAMRDSYLENVEMAQLVHVYDVAASNLDGIRREMPALLDLHRRLSRFPEIIEHERERRAALDTLDTLQHLIEVGQAALSIPRR